MKALIQEYGFATVVIGGVLTLVGSGFAGLSHELRSNEQQRAKNIQTIKALEEVADENNDGLLSDAEVVETAKSAGYNGKMYPGTRLSVGNEHLCYVSPLETKVVVGTSRCGSFVAIPTKVAEELIKTKGYNR